MKYKITTVKGLLKRDCVWDYLMDNLGIPIEDGIGRETAGDSITHLLNTLREDMYVVVEADYIDKVFRDAFYSYFSTKLHTPSRNCVRMSFIDAGAGTFDWTVDSLMRIRKYYKGFAVLRPLSMAVLGRNVIVPDALADHGKSLAICRVNIPSSCLGMKTQASGFPHSSQDGEMMSCAETTIWSIMEYFGNKYPEYTPILPSDIHDILRPTAYQRQLPSNGLTFDQIASVFNHKGFGCVVYNREGNPMFKEIMTCYLESGIPIAVCLESEEDGHAVVGVGHKVIDRAAINKEALSEIYGRPFYVWNDLVEEYVFNDDNLMPYSVAPFNNPTKGYDDYLGGWPDVNITMCIVPLNKKIYLDAEKAIETANYVAVELMKVRSESVIKTFLASSRSYREYLMTNKDVSPKAKEIYLDISMPKFVWICEISDLDSCKNSKVNGIVILDATNPNVDSWPILFAQYDGDEYDYNKNTGNIEIYSLPLPKEFEAFSNNLI